LCAELVMPVGDDARVLEMRGECERCHTALAADGDAAFICSFECTFCAECAAEMQHVCPNCGGVLRQRPARRKTP